MSTITAEQDGAFMRAHLAHHQLATALAELRAKLDTPQASRASHNGD